MAIDEFDTPPLLAEKLIRVADMLCESEPQTVADFAVGTGELLEAVKLRWPQTAVFGFDINSSRVETLARGRTDWTVAECNFLDSASRTLQPIPRRHQDKGRFGRSESAILGSWKQEGRGSS